MQHLGDPAGAIGEMWRVLKPGGVIVLSDFDYGGGLVWPDNPALGQAIDVMGRLHEVDGRSPFVARRLAAMLAESGFSHITPRAWLTLDSPILTPGAEQFWVRYFEAQPVRDYIVAAGLATADEVAAFPDAFRVWAQTPGALWTRCAFEVRARR